MSSFTIRESSSIKFVIAGLVAATVFAVVFASNAWAGSGCSKSGKGKGCEQVSIVASHQTGAALLGSNIATASELGCESDAGNMTTGGNYSCKGDLPLVSISTAELNGLFSRRYWEICRTFSNPATAGVDLAPDQFSYGWLDDCSDGDCAVEATVSFSGSELLDITSGSADQLVVSAYGRIYGTLSDPFAENQEVVIERLNLAFSKSTTGRSTGTCDWYSDLNLEDIQMMLMSTVH